MKKIVYLLPFVLPVLAFGQIIEENVTTVSNTIVRLINDAVIPILFALAILYFLWGVVQYIRSAGDEKKRSDSLHMMLYGIIGIAVMASVWGLVGIFTGFVDSTGGAPELPFAPVVTGG